MALQTTMTSTKVYLTEQMQLATDQSQDSLFSFEAVIKTSVPDKPGARGLEKGPHDGLGFAEALGQLPLIAPLPNLTSACSTQAFSYPIGDRAGPVWV